MDGFTQARTTHSWRLNVSCEPLVLTEEPRPVPKGREVLMKVSHCGVCHSDIHIREGKYNIGGGKVLNLSDRGLKLPLTLGHEILGTVEAVGPDVTSVKPGDRRLLHTWIGCGECALCKSGDENLCAQPQFLGVQARGGFAEHVLVRDEEFLVDVEGLDPALAARARALALDPALRVNEVMVVPAAQMEYPELRASTWQWIRDEYDALAERLGRYYMGELPNITGYFCDEAHAAEVEAFFAPLVDGLEGGPRNLAGALEEIRLCAALVRVQGPALAAYFAENR